MTARAIVLLIGIAGLGEAWAEDRGSSATPPAKDPRQALVVWGIAFTGTYIGEALGNVSGGVRTGAIYTGRIDLGTDVELEKLIGWSGARFHSNVFQIHGRGLSRDYIGRSMLVSGVETLPATRLYEMWIEQSLFYGKLLVKVGQQPSDVEFIDSKYDDIFVNSARPGITGVILPSGGPSPPLAVPGVRIKAQLSDRLTIYFAIFDSDATPPGPEDPQIKNPHGLLFRVNDPPWLIGQARYGFKLGDLPGTITGGAWYHFGSFDNQGLSVEGVSLADPAGSGTPARLRRNQFVFGVVEQQLTHSTLDPTKGVAVLHGHRSVPPIAI